MGDMIELRLDGKINPATLKNVLCEAKIDGARHNWDGTNLVSERGIVRNDRFPHIVDDLRKMNVKCRGEVAVPFGNVLVLNAKENWHRARFYVFDMFEVDGQDTRSASVLDNRHLIEQAIMLTKRDPRYTNLRVPFRFKDFQEGWAWVQKFDLEGLVLKELTGKKQFKVKYLKEEKLPVVGFEPGSVKGCFKIERKGAVGGVSALSVGFVQKYNDMLAKGLQPFVEIEYLFLTNSGVPFQPRLRRLGTQAELSVT